MLSIQAIFGLQRVREPGTVPGINSVSKQSPDRLRMRPKYYSFLCFTVANRLLSTPVVSKTHSFVFVDVHDTERICLRHFISNALIRVSSSFLVSIIQSYVATGHTNASRSQVFVETDMLWFFQAFFHDELIPCSLARLARIWHILNRLLSVTQDMEMCQVAPAVCL